MKQSSIKTALILFFISLIPIGLSQFFFVGQSLRLDESQSLWQTGRGVIEIFNIVASDVHVPLYHLLLHFWILSFGNTVAIARSMSLVFYVISIPTLYVLGTRAYSRTIGIFAAFLFSISPFMNWYGNEIRMYTLLTFFVILNQYFFIRIFQERKINEQVWTWYILTAILGAFSHYFFFLNIAAQAVFYFLRRDLFPTGSLWRFAVSVLIIIASFIPWELYVIHIGQAGFETPLLVPPTSVNLFSTFSQFLFGFQNDNINTIFLSLWPVTVIFALFTLRRSHRMLPETEYFLTTILTVFAVAFFGSFIVTPVFVSRYLIFTIPSLYLLLASLFSNYRPRFATIAQFSLTAIMLSTLAIEIASPTTPVKENYADATTYLNTHTTAQDVIVLSAPFTVYPVQYYYQGPSPITTLPIWNQYAYGAIPAFSESSLSTDVATVAGSSQNVYLLLSYNQGYEKNIKDYFDSHFNRTYQHVFSPDLTLYVYKMRYDTERSAAITAR